MERKEIKGQMKRILTDVFEDVKGVYIEYWEEDSNDNYEVFAHVGKYGTESINLTIQTIWGNTKLTSVNGRWFISNIRRIEQEIENLYN